MSAGTLTMLDRVERYVEWKRSAGYSLKGTAHELRRFARFADANAHDGPVTVSLILQWAETASGCTRLYRARRVEVVRTFARYEATFEPETQIPPRGLLGPAHMRVKPHIYTHTQITALMDAATELAPRDGLRPKTYRTLIGLMASTGLRVCEALHLRAVDFDEATQLLRIVETKFQKSRLVPLHSSVVHALCEYAEFRDAYRRPVATDRFLVSEQGRALLPSVVHYTFAKLRGELALDNQYRARIPRLYDLRHTFACRVLERWYAQGLDVNQRLPYLSTYLGHVKPTDTYWYLSGVPELMRLANARFDDGFGEGVSQ
jgi:integrase